MGKNKGIARRPIEYILVAVFVTLTVFGFWIYWYTGKNQSDYASPVMESVNYSGTVDEINQLMEESIVSEEQLYLEVDEIYTTTSDSSAENVAGVYDESEY